jgi:AcrR family transcriptional regulator
LGPKERREREREEIRTLIMDAARELFASEGVESVTMRRIADRIEYSPTAIYFHFKDKEALLKELCEHDFRDFAKNFAVLLQIPDPIERLRRAGHAYIRFGFEHPSHYRVMFMTPKFESPSETALVTKGNPEEDAYAFLRGLVAQAIAEARLRPRYHDVDLVAQTVWAGVHGVISLEIAKCKDQWVDWRALEERAHLMVEVLIDGLVCEPAAGVTDGR